MRSKGRIARKVGMASFEHVLSQDATQDELLKLIGELNADDTVNDIVVQLPLPSNLNSLAVIAAIDPAKDVDGLHPLNAGRLASGLPGPRLLHAARLPDAAAVEARQARRAGRGRSSAGPIWSASRWRSSCWRENCTVTVAHSKTEISGRRSAGAISWSRRWAGRDDQGGLDQARRDRDRCRHRVGSRAERGEGKTRLRRRRRVRGRLAARGRHHPGARRRGPDDDREPDPQYARGSIQARDLPVPQLW